MNKRMESAIILFLGLTSVASACSQRLLVSSYKDPKATLGAIQTLELKSNGSASTLTLTHTSQDCYRDPTWLDLSLGNDAVLCIDEAIDGGYLGHLTKLSIQSDGSLKKLSSREVLRGPVHLTTYNNKSALVLANYEPPSISAFQVGSEDSFPPIQNFTFPIPDRNDPSAPPLSHIHEAVLDPTGDYVLFPDLGADLVHVYQIDRTTGGLTEKTALKLATGEGPRHATFWTPKNSRDTFFFLIHELTLKISSYKVTYLPTGGLTFQQVDEVSTYGTHATPAGASAAELSLSPDNKFLVASNRNAPLFQIANPDASNSTTLPSDSIATFKPSNEGKLALVQLAPSGGISPRHFELSPDGSKIAVANQKTLNVNIYARSVESGKIGELEASLYGLGPGGLTNVRWV